MQFSRMAWVLALAVTAWGCSAANDAAPSMDQPSTGGSGGGIDTPATGGVTASSGGAGGNPVPSSGGTPAASGGSAPVDRDPNAFSWPESTADGGTVRLCKPGHYTGSYHCNVTGPAGAPAVGFELTGPVELQLSQAEEGEFLVVSGGTLKTSAGALQLDGTLSGKLDCQTGVFEGELVNGQLSIPPFPPGGTATGTLKGGFTPANAGMNGDWSLGGGTAFPGYGCDGPWQVSWDKE